MMLDLQVVFFGNILVLLCSCDAPQIYFDIAAHLPQFKWSQGWWHLWWDDCTLVSSLHPKWYWPHHPSSVSSSIIIWGKNHLPSLPKGVENAPLLFKKELIITLAQPQQCLRKQSTDQQYKVWHICIYFFFQHHLLRKKLLNTQEPTNIWLRKYISLIFLRGYWILIEPISWAGSRLLVVVGVLFLSRLITCSGYQIG